MKLKIKVKRINKYIDLPTIIEKVDWVDLRAAEEVTLKAPQWCPLKRSGTDGAVISHRDVVFDSKLIGLGIAMQLPKGFEATVLPRSSTFKNFGVTLANSKGIIDNSYCGDNDEWKFNAIAFRDTNIFIGDRICQFRIQLSQKATMWQKLKWLFCSGIELVKVGSLYNPDREGIGSTGTR